MNQLVVFSLNVTIANLCQDWERASGGRDGKNMFCASFWGSRGGRREGRTRFAQASGGKNDGRGRTCCLRRACNLVAGPGLIADCGISEASLRRAK